MVFRETRSPGLGKEKKQASAFAAPQAPVSHRKAACSLLHRQRRGACQHTPFLCTLAKTPDSPGREKSDTAPSFPTTAMESCSQPAGLTYTRKGQLEEIRQLSLEQDKLENTFHIQQD